MMKEGNLLGYYSHEISPSVALRSTFFNFEETFFFDPRQAPSHCFELHTGTRVHVVSGDPVLHAILLPRPPSLICDLLRVYFSRLVASLCLVSVHWLRPCPIRLRV